MAEPDGTQRRSPGIMIPVVWGSAAGLFVAVLTQGALGGGIVLTLALLTFGSVLYFSRRGIALRRPRAPRPKAAPRAPLLRRKPLRPPSEMLNAAIGDDLTRIEGVDARTATALGALGVRRFGQIAAWTPEEAARMDATLGGDRAVLRADWIGQAQRLALGKPAGGGDAGKEG